MSAHPVPSPEQIRDAQNTARELQEKANQTRKEGDTK